MISPYKLDLQNTTLYSQHPEEEKSYLGGVGLLKANWHNRQGKMRAVNYGTCFSITPRILLTCAHNIYAEQLMSECDQIQIAPNIEEGYLDQYYSSTQKLIIKREHNKDTFNIKPTKQELCLILLQKPIQKCSYQFKLKSLKQVQKNQVKKQPSRLKIIGYPSQYFTRSSSINRLYLKRHQLQGQLSRVDDFTIYHTAQTQPGISGSPIISFTQQGQPFVVGIHTHHGANGINSGLYFTGQILQKIKAYVDEINKEYSLHQKISFINDSDEKDECKPDKEGQEYVNESDDDEFNEKYQQYISKYQYLNSLQLKSYSDQLYQVTVQNA